MSKTDFANKIIQALSDAIGTDGSKFSSSTPVTANSAIAKAITEYVTENTEVKSVYAGTIPGSPPVVDPIVSDTHSVAGVCAPPVGIDLNSWCISLSANLMIGFLVQPGKNGVTFTCNPFLGGIIDAAGMANGVKNALEAENPQLASWEAIAEEIMKAINSCTPVGGAATNALSGSSGSVTSVAVSIS